MFIWTIFVANILYSAYVSNFLSIVQILLQNVFQQIFLDYLKSLLTLFCWLCLIFK